MKFLSVLSLAVVPLLNGCGEGLCSLATTTKDYTRVEAEGEFLATRGRSALDWSLSLRGDSLAVWSFRSGDSLFEAEFVIEDRGTHTIGVPR